MDMFTTNKYTGQTYYHGFKKKLTVDSLQVGDRLIYETKDFEGKVVNIQCTVIEVCDDHALAASDLKSDMQPSILLWVDKDTIEQFRRKN